MPVVQSNFQSDAGAVEACSKLLRALLFQLDPFGFIFIITTITFI